jgi:hypothetical protein
LNVLTFLPHVPQFACIIGTPRLFVIVHGSFISR